MSNSKESKVSISSPDGAAPVAYTVDQYKEEYTKADNFCSEVQLFKNKAGIPAINELRYAGKHFHNAVDSNGQISDQAQLNDAVGHARRACYDATEAGIMAALEVVAKFKDDYSTIVVSEVIPNYSEILQKAHAAQAMVQAGRENTFDRNGDHDDRIATFRDLRDCCDTLTANRDEANKIVDREINEARKETAKLRYTGIGVALSILGAVYGAPGFVDWLEKRDKQLLAIEEKQSDLTKREQAIGSANPQLQSTTGKTAVDSIQNGQELKVGSSD
ncbi:MAG: hypothetical protein Pars2KO_10050 [Parasphingorhabdus sp.]